MTELQWLAGSFETSAFSALMGDSVDSRKIFVQQDDGYHLVTREGKILPLPCWTTKPEIKSFLFFDGNENGESRLYTLLGDEVSGFRGKRLVALLHFWVVYAENGLLKISHLDQNGFGFKLGVPMNITAYGCLGHDEVILRERDSWAKYVYTDTWKYIQDVQWLSGIVADRIPPLLERGFSYEFIASNCNRLGVQCPILPMDEIRAFAVANDKEKRVFQQLSRLSGSYSTEEISNALGLSSSIMYVLEYYRRLKNVEDL